MKLPTYADLRKFCETEGWEDKDKLARKPKGDHHRYVLTLANGEQLYTRISHSSGRIGDSDLWRNSILKVQLRVTERQFWDCVEKRLLPIRPEQAPTQRREGPSAQLVWNLINKAGLPEKKVASMSKEQVVAAWNDYLTGPEE